jgi:hypothetical protein
LRSAEKDVPPRAALLRALQAAASVAAVSTSPASLASASAAKAASSAANGAGLNATNIAASNIATGATTGGTGAAAATAGTGAGTGALKGALLWLSVGAAGGGLATGIAHEVASPPPTTVASAQSNTAATKADARSRRASAPVEITRAPPSAPRPALDPQLEPVNAGDDTIDDAPQRRITNAPSSSALRERSAAAAAEPALPPARPDFGDELVLVDRARSELAAGDESAALASAATYQKRFPRGQFQSEMLALQIQALAAGDQTGRARDLARSFLARYPSHPLAERVRQASGER